MLRRSRRRQGGISTIEILVALAIIALVIGLGTPSALTWIQNLQVRTAANSMVGGLQTARLEALRRNTTVAFELTDPNSTAWHVCLFNLTMGNCLPGDLAASDLGGQANARAGVETVFSDFASPLNPGDNIPQLVAFDSFGRVSPQSPINIARIDVRNPVLSGSDERRMSIQITTTGQVRMCDPALSAAVNPQGCQ